ncbi:MAG: PD40 domain-containing protein [Colwellia sp.]|nr:PD40 domain-containing protein [Colwellia sp.]
MELSQARTKQWQLGDWLLDAPSLQLIYGGEKINITSKMQDVLLVLLIHKGRPVTKDIIYQQVWPKVIVSEQLIARAISDLRKVLKDNAKNPRYIETVSKAGYRWLGPIYEINESDAQSITLKKIKQTKVKFITLFVFLLIAVLSVYFASSLLFLEKNSNLDQAKVNVSALQPLTSLPGIENAPTISPDGKVLAYVYEVQGSNASQIALTDLNTQRLLTHLPFNTQQKVKQFAPRFSPNGLYLAFTQYNEKQHSCSVYWAKLSNVNQQFKVANCASRFKMSLDWSSDSKALYFTQDITPDIRAIVAANINDQIVEQVTFPLLAGTTDYSPRISKDGSKLIFVRGKLKPSHHSAIYYVNLDESKAEKLNAVPLTTEEERGNIFGLTWKSESSIIYALDQDINQSLRLFSLKNGSDLLLDQGSYHRIDYHEKLDALVFANNQQVSNIVTLALNKEKNSMPVDLISSTRKDHQPRVSPDGKKLAFVADRSGTDQLWIADIDGKEQRQLTHLPQVAINDISWSPDGKNLLLMVQTKLLTKLYTFNLAQLKLSSISTGEFTVSDARWSNHPSWLIASCQVKNVWQICRISSSGGETEILTTASGISPYSPRHSDFIYFTRHGEGLWRMPLLGGKADVVWQDFPEHSWKNWVLYENQLYYLDHKSFDEQTALIKRDLISGESRVIFQGLIKWDKTSFDINPNGNTLFLSIQAPASDDIYRQKIHQ